MAPGNSQGGETRELLYFLQRFSATQVQAGIKQKQQGKEGDTVREQLRERLEIQPDQEGGARSPRVSEVARSGGDNDLDDAKGHMGA